MVHNALTSLPDRVFDPLGGLLHLYVPQVAHHELLMSRVTRSAAAAANGSLPCVVCKSGERDRTGTTID